MSDPTDPVQQIVQENALLRARVADLERQLARFDREFCFSSETWPVQEALLSEAERHAKMGTWIWDVPQAAVSWSPELFRILGYDPNVDVASIEGYFARVHPDDVAFVREASQRGVKSGHAEQTSYRLLLPTGEVRFVRADAAFLFDKSGEIQRAVGTLLDVTDAKRAADDLQHTASLLAEAQALAKLGNWTWHTQSGKLFWSKAVFEILGISHAVEPSLDVLRSVVHVDDQARFARLLEEGLLRNKIEPYQLMLNTIPPRHVLISSIANLDENGTLIGFRGTLQDVTDRAELEEQLRQSQKMEAIGRLAGGIAHDFNNLLTVILANLEFIKTDNTEALADITSAAHAAAGTTRQLLAFGRRAVLKPEVVRVHEAIEGVMRLAERTIGEQIRIEYQLAAEVYDCRVDRGQLEQALLNLILNARDAMPSGGRIRLRTANVVIGDGYLVGHSQVTPGRYVMIAVEDSGVGMDAATRARAFEPFFSTKAPGAGTGLGLSMVFGTVTQSGGFVELYSELGHGAMFKLYFPRADERAMRQPASGIQLIRGAGAHVLVVEDEPSVARVVRAQLEAAGYSVELVMDPFLALSLLANTKLDFQLLITDVVMPGMRGRELVERCASFRPALPVLFITGYAPELEQDELIRTRWGLLQKPFDAKNLLEMVSRLLDTSPPLPAASTSSGRLNPKS